MRKTWSLFIFSIMLVSVVGCSSDKSNASEEAETPFPERSLTAIIPFGAGGSSDTVARMIAPQAEKHLGKSIVLQNNPGGTGAVATQNVLSKPADGYTLLIAAENQNLYRTTGISEASFNDFIPIIQLGRDVPVVVTQPKSNWNSISDLLDEAEQRPGEIKIMSTGPVGVSGIVTAMLDREFLTVPYDSAGAGIAGVIGEHVDVGIIGLSAAREYAESGKVKVLGVVNETKLDDFPDWPALGEERPEYNKHLPWGPYYGVYVKKDTPQPIVDKLVDSFTKGYKEEEFQEFLKKNATVPMGYTGSEALDFQQTWESQTNWLLFDVGVAEDPSKYDIPKP
ncbi:tripartite tricarboxylate transporter substrate binding protein [Sporosarcina sp. 179-K 3D1 HS]|uniref:tripartite tricarboxylate transporter substrate binding protein n=1 Tax=Sporosarcina sp. 179-K 3D1 HS TaxID=3232169 RepID=UPI0039A26DB4